MFPSLRILQLLITIQAYLVFSVNNHNFYSILAMPKLPSHIQPRSTSGAGTGLFTDHSIAAGAEIIRIDQPLVAVLDSPHLQNTCANCFLQLPSSADDAAGNRVIALRDGDSNEREKRRLRSCLGCKVVRYCSQVG